MPLFWLSLAFLAGILLAAMLSLPFSVWIVMAAISLVLFIPPIYRTWSRRIPGRISHITQQMKIPSVSLYPLIFLFIGLGAMRFISTRPVITPELIAYYNDQPVEFQVEGVVAESPDQRDTYTNIRMRVEQLHNKEENSFSPVSGLILVRTFSTGEFQYGDRIQVQGRIQTPAENEDFSYRDYLAHQGIYSFMVADNIDLVGRGNGNPLLTVLYAFQRRALSVIYRIFPDPEASLVAGIILGVQSGIPAEVQEAFRLTGTSHIIVISGFNITIIALMFTYLFSRILGRYKGAIFTTIGIIFYTLMVGANPAVVRAAILGLFTLLGHLIGRRQSGPNSLAFVAAAMAGFTPDALWDVSFQLSFAATLGIMLYAEPFTRGFTSLASHFIPRDRAERLARPVGEYFLITLAAQLTTLPLIVYYFQRISITSLIANPLILPVQPAVMTLGGLAALTGVIFQPLGQLFAWMAWPFTAYTIRVVESLATIPHGSIPLGQVALITILVFYAFLFAFTFARSRLASIARRMTPAIPLALLGVVTVILWKAAMYAPDELLHVTILDVGTADGVLIQSPEGRSILINGGASTNELSDALGRRLLPFNRSLDWLVIADIDNEDLAGIPGNLERFSPTNVLWAGNTYGTRAATELWSQIISQSIPTTIMQPGQALALGSGATLNVLSIDAKGAVLLLAWGNFRMLLPMGMDFSVLESLMRNSAMRNISALILAESGYAPLNPQELIAYLNPQVALLSVAAGDKSGLSSPETIEALKGYNLLRTDQNGWIEIVTDGTRMWVEVENK